MVIRKLLAFALVVAIIPLAFVAIVATQARSLLTHPQIVLDVLEEQQLYDGIYDVVDDGLQGVVEDPLADVPLLTKEDIVPALRAIITPIWLRAQVESVVLGFADWFSGNDRDFVLPIDLQSLKSPLVATIKNLMDDKASTLPSCTVLELRVGAISLNDISCIPQGFDAGLVTDAVENFVGPYLDAFPEDADLLTVVAALGVQQAGTVADNEGMRIEEVTGLFSGNVSAQVLEERADILRQLGEYRDVYHRYRNGLYVLWTVVAVLCAFIVLLLFNTLRSAARILGLMALAEGLLVGAVYAGMRFFAPFVFANVVKVDLQNQSAAMLVKDFLIALFAAVGKPFGTIVGTLLLAGIVLFVVASILPRAKKKEEKKI